MLSTFCPKRFPNFQGYSRANFFDFKICPFLADFLVWGARIEKLVFFSPQDILDLPAWTNFCTFFLATGRIFSCWGAIFWLNLWAFFCEKLPIDVSFFLFDPKKTKMSHLNCTLSGFQKLFVQFESKKKLFGGLRIPTKSWLEPEGAFVF